MNRAGSIGPQTRARLAAIVAALIGLTMAGLALAPPASAIGEIELDVVSSRPDTASGGSSLVQLTLPPSGNTEGLELTIDGTDVTSQFRAVGGNERVRRALLDLGNSGVATVVASYPGRTSARMLVVDHSINGPILSGVRQTPYVCQTPVPTTSEVDCSAPTTVEYRYRLDSGGGWVSVDDPADIPAESLLRLTSTAPTGDRADSVTVPQLIRVETGTINRANYRIGFLVDRDQPDRPGSGWNHRLVYGFGGGCKGGFQQGPVGGANQYLQLNDILAGYAGTGSTQNAFGIRCSDSVSAETLSMVKESFIERFGVPEFTIGKGGSGGSMAQQMIGNNYPGLLDGLQLTNSFVDNAFPGNQLLDCRLIDEFLASPEAAGWTGEQRRAVKGLNRETACAIVYGAFGDSFFDAGLSCPSGLPVNTVFDPVTNPGGTRCTVFEGNVNVYGTDPGTGLVRRPVDNFGVQYGLVPLREGVISVEQFLDLNDGIGGIRQSDNASVPDRSVATTESLSRAYESGLLNSAGAGLASTPVIDNRNYSIEVTDNAHQVIHALSMRERLIKANGDPDGDGSAGTQVIWTSPETLDDSLQLLTMDRWLTAIGNDNTGVSKRDKVLNNRPGTIPGSPAARDACFFNDSGSLIRQETQTDDSGICGTTFPSGSGPRIEAGQPLANDVLKCELKPVDPAEYGVALTVPQITRLNSIFPRGVCDNSRRGVEQQISRKAWRVLPAGTAPDGTAPDTSVSTSFRKRGQSGEVRINFTSSETGSSFQCRFDSAEFTDCEPPLERGSLRVGFHTFEVRATDISGNIDPSPAEVSFVVGYPKATIGMRSKTIRFNRKGRGFARVRCTLTGMKTCNGRATLSVKGRVFGANRKAGRKDRRVAGRKYGVKAGRRSILLKLNGKTKRKLRKRDRVSGKLVFTLNQAGTGPKRVVRKVKLVRKR